MLLARTVCFVTHLINVMKSSIHNLLNSPNADVLHRLMTFDEFFPPLIQKVCTMFLRQNKTEFCDGMKNKQVIFFT